MSEERYVNLTRQYEEDVKRSMAKYQKLQDLDVFVLDNSIRESTVGQLRGHTLESKWEIYNEVKKCGFKNTIVASFSHMTRVDDVFIKQLVDRGEDRSGLFAFSEITEGTKNKVPDTETIPVGLRKLKNVGLWNVIFEIDLGDAVYDFEKFSMAEMCKLLEKWIIWTYDNLNKEAKIFVNFRDLPDAMPLHSDRVFKVVDFLSQMPSGIRPFGLIFEEPGGQSLPEECSAWAKHIRRAMDDNGWNSHLLVHVHEKFGYSDVTALEVLMNGANGIWASVCLEGAALGNASSCVTLVNLIRLGNKKVLQQYNCNYLRKAAINVTKVTTGQDPHDKQPIYGTRALDLVLGLKKDEFDLADFFGEQSPVRITSLASPEMIRIRLVNLFGEDEQFTVDQAYKMKEVMLEDLRSGRKEEYMSDVGLAMLFDRSGGSLTASMRDAITKEKLQKPHAQRLISEIRKRWDTWDLKEEGVGDDMLQYDSFYNGFMAPYFGCYRCSDTKKAIKALDMDADGYIDWNEFMVYLKWAIHQYPDTKDEDALLDIAFQKGIIPAMRDELLKQAE